MAIKARYTSKSGEFYTGIPARDLQDDEYDALTTEQKHLVRHGGLYNIVDREPKAEATAEQPKGDNK